MEVFLAQLKDEAFKQDLEVILQNRKPFRHFKHAVDNSDYRQDWFDFRTIELERHVKK